MFREFHGELLDEGEEDGLGQGAGGRVEYVLGGHLLAQVEDEGEVGGRESRLEGPVQLLRLHQALNLLLRDKRQTLTYDRS